MDRTPVTSSTILSLGYHAASETLEVEFVNGHVYQYAAVPPGEHEALLSARSIGGYFNAQIRPNYAYVRL